MRPPTEPELIIDPPDILGPVVIVLTPLSDDVPARVRVRRLLKLALRGFNLRCRVVRYPTLPELLAPNLEPHPDEDEPDG